MTRTIAYAACAAFLAVAASAAAQAPSGPPLPAGARTTGAPPSANGTDPAGPAATAPATGSPSTAPATGSAVDSSATSGAATAVVSGMSVKDKTGALIGEITAVKPDASGQNLATVKMGSDNFTVETNKLAVQNGVASINASQAELKQMLPKK